MPWSSRLDDLPGNLVAAFTRPRYRWEPPAGLRPALSVLRQGVMRPRSFLASALVHAGVISLLFSLSPFLRPGPPTAEELRRQHALKISWYYYSDELPQVADSARREQSAEPEPASRLQTRKRQTIESNPLNPDNNRQTIVQPDAPDIKIATEVRIPNVVMWGRQPERPSMEYLPPPDVRVPSPGLPAPMPSSARPAELQYLPAPDIAAVPSARPPLYAPVRTPSLEYLPAPDIAVSAQQAPKLPAGTQRPSVNYLPPPDVRVVPRPSAAIAGLDRRSVPSLDYLPAPDVRAAQPLHLPSAALSGSPSRPTLDYLPAPDVRMPQMPAHPPAVLGGAKPPDAALAYLPAPNIAVPAAGARPIPTSGLPAVAPPPPPASTAAGQAGNGRRLIAVGVDPAPPGGPISVPAGNRSGSFTVAGESANGGKTSGGERNGLRVPGLAISGGTNAPSASEGPVVSTPAPTLPEPPAASAAAPPRSIPSREAVQAAIARDTARSFSRQQAGEQRQQHAITLPKKVYTIFLNTPNTVSQKGSWVLRFSEFGERKPGAPDRNPGAEEPQISAPVAIRSVDPRYDRSAFNEKVEGDVLLYAIIRRSGRVESVRVLRGLDARLDESAVAAFQKWEFHPATRNGIPVDIETTVRVPFFVTSAENSKH